MAESTPLVSVPPSPETTQESKWTFGRVVKWATGGIVAFFVLIFALSLLAIAFFNAEGAASLFGYIRDIATIMMIMQIILIITGVGILLVQIARFVNLLRSEVKPIAQETKDTLQTVRTTTEFVGKQAAEPLITINAFMAGLFTFTKTLFSIKALMSLLKRPKTNDE